MLDLVFTRLATYGLKVKASKCHLFQHSVNFLDHMTSAENIRADPENTAVVKGWLILKILRQL